MVKEEIIFNKVNYQLSQYGALDHGCQYYNAISIVITSGPLLAWCDGSGAYL